MVHEFSLESSDNLVERDRETQSLLGVLSAQGVPKEVLKDQIISVIIGGRESVAIIITWALYELVRHPNVLCDLRKEISEVLGSNAPSPSQLEGLDLLNSVVLETMRQHTSVGINIRSALKDTSLPTGGGPAGTAAVGIPAGTSVIMGLDSVHRRTEIYGPDANDYKPNRWNANCKPDTWSYFPFNRGPRSCLRKNMATIDVKYALCRLLQVFGSIELLEKVGDRFSEADLKKFPPMKTKMAFNTKPAGIVWLRFEM